MAVNKIFNIELDLKRTIGADSFEVVEGDSGNILHITVTDSGQPVDLGDARVVAIFSKASGIALQDSNDETHGITISGNTVDIELKRTSYTRGLVECELQIYSVQEGNLHLVTSAKFNFNCRESMISGSDMQSSSDYPVLISLINELNETIDIVEAAIDRVSLLSDGANAYVHIRYSSENPLENALSTMSTSPDEYIGIATSHDPEAPLLASEYTWYRWKGEYGDSACVHIRYSSTNPEDASVPCVLTTQPDQYIGLFVGSSEIAPTAPESYTWYKWRPDEQNIYIRYAANDLSQTPDSADFSQEPNEYMGICVSVAKQAPSTAGHYTWYRIRGDAGEALPSGAQPGDALISDGTAASWGSVSAAKVVLSTGENVEEAFGAVSNALDTINGEEI